MLHVNSVNSANSYSAVLPPSPMVFFSNNEAAILSTQAPPTADEQTEEGGWGGPGGEGAQAWTTPVQVRSSSQ